MKNYLESIEKSLNEFNFGDNPFELYEPIRYILSLGGKRIRPLFTLMTCHLFQDQFEKAIYPALGVEVFHNFTLLHDDIMDNAPLRRGSPTVHEKWNSNVAILSGDVMLVKAYELFLKSGFHDIQKMLSKFNKCAAEVCEGQQLDMNFETRDFVQEDEYLEMIRLKTAVLIGFAIELGAIIGGTDKDTSNKLYEFGVNIGLGFQLKDDLLDVYADSEKFGKQVGGDIISNKKTYLLIKALEIAKGEMKAQLIYWIERQGFDPREKVNAVISIYNTLGIKKLCEEKMRYYFQTGQRIFNSINIDETRKEPLRELVQKLIEREK
ncbi:MAG: polyprenyl synthetase family protein [Cytophagales bacterium]|nr:polyprenyl synthetase family protein [Cytophagales bacterium]